MLETPFQVPFRDASTPDQLRAYRLDELAELATAAEDWIVSDGLLTRGGKLLLFGKAGVGKTTLLIHLAASLASGTPFLGRFAVDRAYRVLVVQGELGRAELASHGQHLLATAGYERANPNLFFFTRRLRLPEDESTLEALVKLYRAEIVLLDPYICFFSGESTDKAEQVGEVFACLDHLLEGGLVQAVGVVHHAGVGGGRPAGSYEFEAWPSTILHYERAGKGSRARRLTVTKVRAPGVETPRPVMVSHEDGCYVLVGPDGIAAVPVELRDADQAPIEVDRGSDLTRKIERLVGILGGREVPISKLERSTRLPAALLRDVIDRSEHLTRTLGPKPGRGKRATLISLSPTRQEERRAA